MAGKISLEQAEELDRRQIFRASASPTATPDLRLGCLVYVSLDGNVTIGNPSPNISLGQKIQFIFKQDATGSRTISWGTAYRGTSNFIPNTSASTFSAIEFISDGAGGYDASGSPAVDIPARLVTTAFNELSSGILLPALHPVSASSGALTPDFSSYVGYSVKLDAGLTINAPSAAPVVGQEISFVFYQDTTGGRVVTFNSAYVGAPRFTPRQGPSQGSSVRFIYTSSNTYELVEFDGIDTDAPINVLDFGAKDANLFGGQDNTPYIQNAIAYAQSFAVPRSVLVPDANLQMHTPLVISGSNITIRGTSRYSSKLNVQGNFEGPQIIVCGTSGSGWAKPAIGSGPYAGMGSWQMDGTSNYYLKLNDSPNFRHDGLAGCYMSIWAKPTSLTAGFILKSSGGVSSVSGTPAPYKETVAFEIVHDGDDTSGKAKLTGRLNVGGTLHAISSTAGNGMVINAWSHLAMDYDGSTLRLFLNGTSVATASISGSVSQSALENVVIGPDVSQQGGVNAADMIGFVSSFEFCRASQHASNFTPTAGPVTLGSDTQMFGNFDQETNNAYSVGTIQFFNNDTTKYSRPVYFPIRRRDNGGNLQAFVELSNLNLGGGGVYTFATSNFNYNNLVINGSSGIVTENNSFISKVSDCFINSTSLTSSNTNVWPSRYGVSWGGACGWTTEDVTVTGYMFEYMTLTAGCQVTNLFCNPQSDTVGIVSLVSYSGVEFGNNATELSNIVIDAESSAPNFVTCCYAQDIQALNVNSGQWDCTAALSGHSPFYANACGVINFNGAMVAEDSGKACVNSIDSTTIVNFFGSCLAKGLNVLSTDLGNATNYSSFVSP